MAVVGMVGSPFVGALIDRVSLRLMALVGVIAYSITLASISLIPGTIVAWWSIWITMSVVGLFSKQMLWTLAVAKKFNLSRGLAFACVTSGTGLFAIFVPVLAQTIISHFGWRAAYLALGIIVLVIALPHVYFGLREKQIRGARSTPILQPSLVGLTFRDAAHGRRLWQLAAASLLAGGSMGALLVHLVPALREHGLSPTVAASIAGATGAATVIGRLTGGVLLDRLPGHLLGTAVFLIPIGSCLILLQSHISISSGVAAAVCLGLALGAEVDVIAYLSSRYFGMKSYGSIFGLIVGVIGMGAGMAPAIVGFAYDRLHSYNNVLVVMICSLLAGGLLTYLLGPYPQIENQTALPEKEPLTTLR